ncbi:CDP-alcohol phosphatidyltransferase family protein [Microbacterium sp. SSM24]|uniref:CDP-alcohol phosphatidyltransferase family protein n=1 Tax=Microbacterium sp. SSM24 TaxID=2991714 RepID=UPI002227F95A|nr:CDP-alcohol phosphatidyltransferase family protein [Microbacterium sp. SSM24]MCW3493136.1 CDP-alcohol phosphatidyltransferase family protein [Microbacterium sp. SSM24]
MPKVHLAPLASLLAGVAGLILVALVSPLSAAGWTTGLAYLLASNALLARGLHRRAMWSFGPANAATATRSTLVALVTALIATSFTAAVPVPLLIVLASTALALDAVDGWLARRTHSESELGARFDMEVDAFLLLVLSAYVAQTLGGWVLVIGLLRYAFVAAGWVLPWMRATLPPRYWRKVVTAVSGIALIAAASGLLPSPASLAVTLLALALLLESFGRDVVWLAAHRLTPAIPAHADHPRNVRSTT